ncbi:TPA: hypothetical protein HA251_05910 [Candidatus Woesearchaeota archaeon]|nr:hypothetical protein [Candidatus Woesearchaeota archaeon]
MSSIIELETVVAKLSAINDGTQWNDIASPKTRCWNSRILAEFSSRLARKFTGPIIAETFLLVGCDSISRMMQGETMQPYDPKKSFDPIYGLRCNEYAELRDSLPAIAAQIDPAFGIEVKTVYDEMLASMTPTQQKMYKVGLF